VSFPGESLDLVGRMTTAPVASLPPWRRRLGSSAGGGRLLFSENLRFCACLRSFRLHRLRLYWSSSGGCFAAVLLAGGYFAAVLLWRILCRCRCVGNRFGRMLCRLDRSGGCFATFVVLLILAALAL